MHGFGQSGLKRNYGANQISSIEIFLFQTTESCDVMLLRITLSFFQKEMIHGLATCFFF